MTPVGIDQRLVGDGDAAESGRSFVITGIDVRMIDAGQTLVRAANVAVTGLAAHTEHHVEVHSFEYEI